MKSAYELAMERLEKSAPSVALTEEQKKQIAELDSKYRAKIAEKELFLRGEIAKTSLTGDSEGVAALEQQLGREVQRLRTECEAKKQKIRDAPC